MNDRCEPPPALRDQDGEHWLCCTDIPVTAYWYADLARWTIRRLDRIDPAAMPGWRYLCPVAPPAEVEALRRERDAAVEAWKASERRADQCRQTAETHRSDNATLRADNARLREALMFYAKSENYIIADKGMNWVEADAGIYARAALKEPTP